MVHQIVLGPPTVFDLEPLQPKQFEERNHISIAAAEELAERGILIPNLYARNPKDWEGMEHLMGLVKRALVNGERVDAYFKARDYRYENFVTAHAEQLEKSVSELEKANPDQVKVVCFGRP